MKTMSGDELIEAYIAEIQYILDSDLELASEFFSTKEFPTNDKQALKEWISTGIEDQLPESKSIAKFLKILLKPRDIADKIVRPKGLK